VAQIGENIIGNSAQTPFFKVANADQLGIQSPDNRLGDALRVWARSLSGFQKEAMVRSALTGDTWRFVCDEGPYLSGYDEAPCPLAFLSTGMVASFMNEILALGEQRNANIRSLKLVQDNFYTSKGSMLKRTMTGGAENIELQVDIDCDLEDDALTQFLTDATFASPLNGLMRGKLDSLFKLASNGVELRPSSSTELDAPMFPDPGQHFPNAEPLPSDLELMWKVGTTPVKEVAKGTQLQQMQYSPHGTSFGFLSSEDGLAPDANTLISAGIAFCFMTQFGRAASMLKLDLSGYRIIQDSHFSLGGASGGTGKAGEAHPIETHAFLQTAETDETAQEMLDIAERTCFLHAFCRTDLKTILKINRV